MSKITLAIISIIIVLAIIFAIYLVLNMGKNSTGTNTTNNVAPNNPTGANKFEVQGMKIEIEKQGSGDAAKNGDTVTVNYVGTLDSGKKFDSSYDRNAPFTFALGAGHVIKGWDLGVAGMKVGEKRKLIIPAELGYGTNGFPPIIPKNATLTFEVELLNIQH